MSNATPNPSVNRTAFKLRLQVRSGLRPSPAGYVQRWASLDYRPIFKPLKQQMENRMKALLCLITIFSIAGCATPPTADPSTVEQACAQQCSSNLATCSSGFKLFPVVAQKQCNDTYDVCINGCPARMSEPASGKPTQPTTSERLKKLEELFKSGAISKEEYEGKRKDILNSL